MRIDSSVVGMESVRSYRASSASVRRFMIRDYQVDEENQEKEDGKDREVAGEETQTSMQEWQNRFGIKTGLTRLREENSSINEDIRQITLRYIFDMLFASRRHRLHEWMEERGFTKEPEFEKVDYQSGNNNGNNNVKILSPTKMRSLSISQESWYSEQESTSFSTMGTVKTADGREIHFNVDVEMSRSFEEYFREDLEITNFSMCDPLVINLDVGSAQLKDQKFFFDLDADGQEDEISVLGSGSGFLALDKNGDGKINDGSELFGTSSGDGFKDLAQYDQDGNGWIDENDEIWSKLQIWTKDENGKDVLYKLSEKNVGAIYLGNVSTDFSLVGQEGNTNGLIRKTGVFLYENGTAGTIQHVDLAKYQKEA